MKAKYEYHAFLICLQEALATEELPITLDLGALAAALRSAKLRSKKIDKFVKTMTCLGNDPRHREELLKFVTRAIDDEEATGIAIHLANGEVTLSRRQPPDGSLDDIKKQRRFS